MQRPYISASTGRAYERIDLTPFLPRTDPSGAAFQAAITSLASGSYWLGAGTYDFNDVQVTLPAFFDLELHPEAVVRNGRIIHSTTDGAEVPLTSAIAAGSRTIPVDNNVLGAVAGDDLFLMGCLDLLSADAGVSRLGTRQTGELQPMFAGERVRVYSVTDSEITIGGNQNGTVFPYTITPGASSGTRTVSTVRKCTAGNMRWVGGKMQRGSTALSSSPIVFRLTGGAGHVIGTRIQFDQDQTAGVGIYSQRVFGGDFKVDVRRKLHITGSGASSHNSVLLVSCQNTFVTGRVDGGFQALDITHALDGTGTASVGCGARDWKVYSAYEAATDHMGNIGSSFIGVRNIGCNRGIRLRSPNALVQDYQGISPFRGGTGIYVCNGWTDGCHIDGALIDGHLFGLQVDRGNADDSAESPAAPPRITGRGIKIKNASFGVFMNTLDATLSTDQKRAVGSADIEVFIEDCDQPVKIGAYWNGAKVFGSISGPPDSPDYPAISLLGNASNVTLGPFVLHNLGGAAVALKGPGAGSALLTDATTWPEGDEAANLRILDLSVTGEPPLALVEDLTIASTTPLGFGREFGRRQMRGSTAVVDDAGVELNTIKPNGFLSGAQWDAFATMLSYDSTAAGIAAALSVVVENIPFTPSKIPDALSFARFDFEEAAQITTSGASITSFADPISAGAWAQATGAAQPQLDATGFNGRQCGTLDGGDSLRNTDAVATLDWPTGSAFEVWALFHYTGLVGAELDTAFIFQYPTNIINNAFSLVAITALGVRRIRARVGTGSSNVALTSTVADLLDGEPHIARFVSTGTTIRLDVDGIVGTPVACVAALSGGPVHTIGGDSAGTSANLFTGKMNYIGLYPALPDGLANALYNALDIRRTP